MTVEAARDAFSAAVSPMPARPVAFDGLFGWFSPGVTRRGVVLCGTLGFEQLSAYRAWRGLAEAITATGCASLRFDYPGEGDSGDAGAGRVASLVAAIRRAMRYLREEAQAEEIVLVGLRLGGTLAALAALEGGVDRLVLLAPFATGRAYLREMQLQARTTVIWPGGLPLESKPGTINVHGFILSEDLIGDINQIDNKIYSKICVPHVLIVDKPTSKISSFFTTPGAKVKQEFFANFNEILSGEMNFKPVSEVIERFEYLNNVIARFSADGAYAGNAKFHLEISPSRITGSGWEEESTFFGDGLFGIICRPDNFLTAECSVLFVNSGTYVRSGSSRYTARLARTLAARGVTSFRIDLKGMGDSPDWLEKSSPVYNIDALEDVKSAIDRLQLIIKVPIIVIGICSGAYLAFHVTCRDERVTDAVLTNLYCFDWPTDVSLETVLSRPTVRSTSTYAKSLLNRNTWQRIAKGNISVFLILLGLLRVWSKELSRRWPFLYKISHRGSSVIDRVANVRRRGGRFVFVYSADDPGILNIQGELNLPLIEIDRALGSKIEVIDQCDHNLSTPASQIQLTSILIDLINQRIGEART